MTRVEGDGSCRAHHRFHRFGDCDTIRAQTETVRTGGEAVARTRIVASLVVLLVVAVASACGGGGGEERGDFSTLPTLTPTPQREPKPRPSPVEAAFTGGGMPIQTQARVATVSGAERITFAFEGDLPGYRIEYVDKVERCGSGEAVELRGNALMLVSFEPAAAHDEAGKVTVPATKIRGFGSVVLELELVCDLEGKVQWVVGVVDNQPFTVTTAQNPSALVVDVSSRR